ncbi:hypothetical protein TWF718_001778 [Orbilia javanica]|uniref:Uncharacterized protein n=1 Tax=Orbilia javanica TaxID=47235 RepID=A0AAN8N1U6_9PEZI
MVVVIFVWLETTNNDFTWYCCYTILYSIPAELLQCKAKRLQKAAALLISILMKGWSGVLLTSTFQDSGAAAVSSVSLSLSYSLSLSSITPTPTDSYSSLYSCFPLTIIALGFSVSRF